MIDQEIIKYVDGEIRKSQQYSQRRTGDTPTDNLQLVPKKYVNLNGTTANRPTSSVASTGQQYFDSTIGRPVYWNGTTGKWVDGAGSIS